MDLRQNTATTFWIGPFMSTDGVSHETGLTVTYYIAKTNGNFLPTTGVNAESTQILAFYKCLLTAGNVDTLGPLMIASQSSGDFLSIWDNYNVVTANYYDTRYGTDEFQVDVVQVVGSTSDADDLGNLNDVSTTDIWTQSNAVMVNLNLDNIINVDALGADPTTGTYLDLIMNKNGSQTFSKTNDSLEAIRDQGDAAWGTNILTSTDILTQVNSSTGANVNIIEILGSTNATDKLLNMFDGTGYAGGAIRLQSDWVETNGDTEIDTGLTPATWTKEIYSKLINDSYKDSNEYKFYGSTGAYLFSINIATTSRTRSS